MPSLEFDTRLSFVSDLHLRPTWRVARQGGYRSWTDAWAVITDPASQLLTPAIQLLHVAVVRSRDLSPEDICKGLLVRDFSEWQRLGPSGFTTTDGAIDRVFFVAPRVGCAGEHWAVFVEGSRQFDPDPNPAIEFAQELLAFGMAALPVYRERAAVWRAKSGENSEPEPADGDQTHRDQANRDQSDRRLVSKESASSSPGVHAPAAKSSQPSRVVTCDDELSFLPHLRLRPEWVVTRAEGGSGWRGIWAGIRGHEESELAPGIELASVGSVSSVGPAALGVTAIAQYLLGTQLWQWQPFISSEREAAYVSTDGALSFVLLVIPQVGRPHHYWAVEVGGSPFRAPPPGRPFDDTLRRFGMLLLPSE